MSCPKKVDPCGAERLWTYKKQLFKDRDGLGHLYLCFYNVGIDFLKDGCSGTISCFDDCQGEELDALPPGIVKCPWIGFLPLFTLPLVVLCRRFWFRGILFSPLCLICLHKTTFIHGLFYGHPIMDKANPGWKFFLSVIAHFGDKQ